MKLDTNGMEVRWEDDSKALQSLVFMRPEVRYHVSGTGAGMKGEAEAKGLRPWASCEGKQSVVRPGAYVARGAISVCPENEGERRCILSG